MFKSPSKKAKTSESDPVKDTQSYHFVLKDAYPAPAVKPRTIITPRRLDAARSTTRKVVAPSSAPAAAGRSPKSKRVGILSRRRVSASPFTRVDPPSFGLSNGLPFSIDAALAGTVASYKPEPLQTVSVPLLEESVPKSWMFDIHEDTADDELGNLMQFSTQTLDISDDESRVIAKDDRGKENIPPNEHHILPAISPAVLTGPVSRKDMMTDEPRTPLGDLDAAEFYAEGCDSASYVIVPTEKGAVYNDNLLNSPVAERVSGAMAEEAVVRGSHDNIEAGASLSEANVKMTIHSLPPASPIETPTSDINIWESESAKGDDDTPVIHTSMAPLEDSVSEIKDYSSLGPVTPSGHECLLL